MSRTFVRLRGSVPWLVLWPLLLPTMASAHELDIAELRLRELSKGQFAWHWDHGAASHPRAEALTPRWPEGCSSEGQSLRCPDRGMVGPFSIAGVGQSVSAALVRVDWLDGGARTYTLSAAKPSVYFRGSAHDARGPREIATAYVLLGVEHILRGLDHLAFVISLLFLVGFGRRLMLTISAFTLAHSVTLAGSVLGFIALRSAPVEACIALSIALVASEALHARQTLTRRLPELVAFVFGLAHGAGFAGALREAGLPEHQLPVALFAFNVGVEIGQLLTVLLAYALTRALSRVRFSAALRTPVLYLLGAAAAYWSFERMAVLGAL